MKDIGKAGTYTRGTRSVKRLGYGAMQLAGPGVFGPPKDRKGALAVLREAVESGVDHVDTSDFYGPHVTNQTIKEVLHPYRDDLIIVTKVGARRGADGSWIPAFSRQDKGAVRRGQRTRRHTAAGGGAGPDRGGPGARLTHPSGHHHRHPLRQRTHQLVSDGTTRLRNLVNGQYRTAGGAPPQGDLTADIGA